jgi:hypothetical protein
VRWKKASLVTLLLKIDVRDYFEQSVIMEDLYDHAKRSEDRYVPLLDIQERGHEMAQRQVRGLRICERPSVSLM